MVLGQLIPNKAQIIAPINCNKEAIITSAAVIVASVYL